MYVEDHLQESDQTQIKRQVGPLGELTVSLSLVSPDLYLLCDRVEQFSCSVQEN